MTDKKSFIHNWYGKHLPAFHNFIDFAVRSCEFANHVAGVNKISVVNSNTAYMDESGKIFHPAMWYTKKYYTNVLGLDVDDAIYAAVAFHNGGQIHESLHVLLTPFNSMKKIQRKVFSSRPDWEPDKLLGLCFNLIEDIYIETYGKEMFPNIFNYNRFVNDIYFPDERIDGYLTELSPDNNQELINALICWKRDENRSKYTGDYLKPFVDVLQKATNVDLTIDERFDIAIELYDLIKQENIPDTNLPNMNVVLTSDVANEQQEYTKLNAKELDKIEAEFDDKYFELNPSKINSDDGNFQNHAEKLKFEFDLPSGRRVDLDKRFSSFARYIQLVRTPKPDYYLAQDRGNTILDRELYRIGIDGNCLTDKVFNTNKKDKPQFLILVDSSGSMGGIYRDVVKSAGSIFMSLATADIPVSLWGHSGPDYPVVYGICSYQMPFRNKQVEITSNPYNRISNAIQIPLYENYDGFVIQSLSDYFTTGRVKYMIVLSDGAPSGDGYRGDSAIEHTKRIVKNVRNKGVNVYSISLTQDVTKSNDEIYGSNYNIKGYKNLDSEMQKLVTNLI